MIEFLTINDDDPALAYSPMVDGIKKVCTFYTDNGPIGLTPSNAFKRTFVHWAAANFNWPQYTEDDLFRINKVLNESDFPPLMDIHDLMIALKIGRHYRRKFRFTKEAQALVSHPGRLFGVITPYYLFEFDHLRFSRMTEQAPGNWDIFLNVLHTEAENGISGCDLDQVFYGNSPKGIHRHDLISLYVQVLRPLIWTGLLAEKRAKGAWTENSIFTKTPLWHSALRLR